MTAPERAGALLSGLLPLVVLVGLHVRQRLDRCWAFPAYLASVSAFNLAVAGWPSRFFGWSTWLTAEIVQGTLVLLVATEITLRAFARLPSGLRAARLALLSCLMGSLAIAWSAGPNTGPLLADLASDLAPRLATARTATFLSLLAVTLYYSLPLDDLHLAVVRGLALYSGAAAVGLVVVRDAGWQVREPISALLTAGYILVLVYWVRAAWGDEPGAPPSVARRLWPWRS